MVRVLEIVIEIEIGNDDRRDSTFFKRTINHPGRVIGSVRNFGWSTSTTPDGAA